jgi:HSP20 family protein
MALVRLNNRDFAPVRNSYKGVDDMFNWFLNEKPSFGECNNYPSANILETEDDFKIEMLVPGYTKEDIRIQFENGFLSISHEGADKGEDELDKYISREFYRKDFNRRFKLSDRLASEKINASYENGVLEIAIPKKEEAKAKPVQEISIS